MSVTISAREVAQRLGKASRAGQGWKCSCPAHDDAKPSLLLYDKPIGFAYKCMAGCTSAEVRSALQRFDLWPGTPADKGRPAARRPAAPDASRDRSKIAWPLPEKAPQPDWERLLGWMPTYVHIYQDAAGKALFFVARRDKAEGGKDVRPITPWLKADGSLVWRLGGPPEPRPLYGLNLLADRLDAPVLVVEGEKTADVARKRFPDYVVVTWQGGSSAVAKADWRPLAGREVVAWPDNDEAGRAAMARLDAILKQPGKEGA